MCCTKIGQAIKPNERASKIASLFATYFNEKMSLIYDVYGQINSKRDKLSEELRKCHPELEGWHFSYDFKKEEIIITGKM